MKFSIKDFVLYCKKNIIIVVFTSCLMLLVYGIKLANITIDCDGIWYLNQEWKSNMLWWIALGRWGIAFIKLLRGNNINYYLDTFVACILLMICALMFCYLFDIISEVKGRWPLALFAVFFVVSPIWIEMNHSNFMSVEVMISVALSPVILLLFLYGVSQRIKKYMIFAIILAVFATSVYQANWCLLLGAISAVLILIEERISNNEEQKAKYKSMWCLSYGLLAITGIGYFISNKIIQLIFHSSSGYVSNMVNIGKKEYWFFLCKFFYKIFLADFTPLNEALKTILAHFVEGDVLANISWNTSSSALLHLPLVCCFAVIIVMKKNKSIFLGLSVGTMILSVLMLGLLGGNVPGRSLYALPFVGGFLIYYILMHIKKRGLLITAYAVIALGTLHQARKSAMLLYSDYRRYEWDVSTLEHIVYRLEPLMTLDDENREEKQLLVVGGLKCPLKEHFLRGECIGDSLLETHTFEFLHYMGYKYLTLENNKGLDYTKCVKHMPNYPDRGCIKEIDGVVILKLSDENQY